MARSIAEEPPAGTVSISSSITDERPDVYVYGSEGLSPSDQADLMAGTPDPEETYEEYMERHAD